MSVDGAPTIRGYMITGVLGQGGMGRVYRAQQVALRREVALKVLHAGMASTEDGPKRFRREMRIHTRLNHPGIVPVYDADHVDGFAYLAMELVEGGSLVEDLRDRGPCGTADGILLVRVLAEALAYLHEQGIVHRDLKPGNVLLDPGGRPRLTDFGLARREASTLLTGESTLLGTLPYIAPEVFEGAPVGPAADVYALGLLAYELFLARPLFCVTSVSSPHALAEAIREGGIPPVGFYLPGRIPGEVEDLMLEMVSRAPEARPIAREVATRMRQLQDRFGVESYGDRGPSRWSRMSPGDPVPPEPGVGDATEDEGRATTPIVSPRGAGAPLFPAPGRVRGPAAWAALLVLIAAAAATRTLIPPAPPALEPGLASPGAADVARGGEGVASGIVDREALRVRMRTLAAEAMERLDRYDQSCTGKPASDSSMLLRAGILRDAFHRPTVGDLGLMFTAINRLLEAVRAGDEAGLDDPVWLDLERIAYELLQEAGCSHGFDTGNVLRAPLTRLVEQIAGGGEGPYRRLFAQSLLPHLVYLEVNTAQTRLVRLRECERLLADLEDLPEAWRRSSRGKLEHLVVLLRLEDLLNTESWMAVDDARKAEAAARLRTIHRRNFDHVRSSFARWAEGPGEPDLEVRSWTRWCLFHVLCQGLAVLPDGSPELADALRMLDGVVEGLSFDGLPPSVLFIALKESSAVLTLAKGRPAMGLPSGVRKRLETEVAAHPEVDLQGRVTLSRSRRPAAADVAPAGVTPGTASRK